MGDIKPIQTYYNGYHFRSRLEARWAVFFDVLGVKYDYEPEGYVLSDGSTYLPDFKIYDVEVIHANEYKDDIFVEVKGNPTSEDCRKLRLFAQPYSYNEDGSERETRRVWTVGNIPYYDDYVGDMEEQREEYCKNHKRKGLDCTFCQNVFDNIDGDDCFPFSIDFEDHLIFRGYDSSYGYGRFSKKVSNAFKIARQSRFEHGEKPN